MYKVIPASPKASGRWIGVEFVGRPSPVQSAGPHQLVRTPSLGRLLRDTLHECRPSSGPPCSTRAAQWRDRY